MFHYFYLICFLYQIRQNLFLAFVYNVISPGDFSYLVPVFALAYVKIGGDSHVALARRRQRRLHPRATGRRHGRHLR